MSAFVVTDRCLSFIAHEINRQWKKKSKNFPGVHEEAMEVVFLAKQLAEMNIDAVNYRYQEETPYPTAVDILAEDSSPFKVQTLRDFNCYLYQCSEGDVPERVLFKELIRIRDRLDKQINKTLQPKEREALSEDLLWG